ncbi:branched-chain amino acid ABC transporter permease [Candidatus Woesearchaeota archaeon]|nr:branched-chain amino acid ABC transporter permease [Candidatus Woesearchaeota archaeon]
MPSLSILPQLIVNGLIAGSIYALAASGFSLAYYVIRFLHFAQGAAIAIAAYALFTLSNQVGLNGILSILLTISIAVAATLLMNYAVYTPLRKRKATGVILLISSLAILTFTASLIRALFGPSTKTLLLSKHNKSFDFGLFTITSIQLAIIISAVLLFLLLWILMRKTRLGKAMRALSDNKEVAQVVGINPEKIYTYTFIIAGIFAGISGILIGLEQNLYPRMSVIIIVKGFISSVVGGINSVPGAIIGGLFIGLVENLGIWFLPSGYKDAISFSILLLFLLLRPRGILGRGMRDDT